MVTLWHRVVIPAWEAVLFCRRVLGLVFFHHPVGDSRQAIDRHEPRKFKVLAEHIGPIGQKLPIDDPILNRRKCLAHLLTARGMPRQARPADRFRRNRIGLAGTAWHVFLNAAAFNTNAETEEEQLGGSRENASSRTVVGDPKSQSKTLSLASGSW